jgi:nucleoside-diphosphate-sugar epimerase
MPDPAPQPIPLQTSPAQTALAQTALILGCGFLGQILARKLIARAITVYGTVRSERSATHLAALGVRPLILSVTQKVTLAAIRPLYDAGSIDVYYMIPPGPMDKDPGAARVVMEGLKNITTALRQARIRSGVLVSSTSVYGKAAGSTPDGMVDADTVPEPADDRSRLLLEGENLWLAARSPNRVARLAGLYGPGRIIGKQAVLDGSPIAGDPQAAINLIHVQDAADLLIHMAQPNALESAPGPARVELGVDNKPVARIDYYTHLAGLLGAKPPSIMTEAQANLLGLNVARLRNAANKRCSSRLTQQRTLWRPVYESYIEGLADALAKEHAPA